jgi:type I restriction enzyme, S subunit
MSNLYPLSTVLSDAEVFTDGDWIESKDQDPNGDVRLTQLADVGDGRWIDKSARYLTAEKAKQLRCTFLKSGDILLARMPDPLGRCCIFPGSEIPCVTVVDVCVIRPNPERVFSRYLMHSINAPIGRRGILRHVTGTTRQRISRKNLGKVEIPLPPLEEQKRIAGILDAADRLRAQRRETLGQLDTLLQSTFLELFGDPVTNPKGWEFVQLGEHTTKVGSGSTPRGGNDAYKAEGISLIRSLNVRDGEFKWKALARIDDAQAKKLSNVVVELDDVLLNITGASVARVCRCPDEVLPARVNQHVCIIRTKPSVLPKFLEKLLLSGSMKNKLLGIGESGATRQAITKAQVLNLDIPLPPLGLQRRFAAIVESVEKQKTRQRAHLAELDALFASLQSRAFNGEL